MVIRNLIQSFRHFGEDPTGYISDDTSFSDFAIYQQLVRSRAVIVKDRDRKEYFNHTMFQTLPCVMFEEVDANECGLIPRSRCKILKSTCPTPNILKLISVTSQLGNQTFDYVRWDQTAGKLNSRIESIRDSVFATIRTIGDEQYIYLINDDYIKNGVVVAIFEDPVIAAQFCGDQEALCNPMELDFHTDAKLTDVVLKLSYDTILGVRRAAKPDVVNDDTNLQ